MDIPKFLIEMSEQMNVEDVRCTAEPIWMVCYDKWLTCADGRGDKEIYLINDHSEYAECDNESEVITYMHDNHTDWIHSIKVQKYEDDCLCDDYDSLEHYLESDDFELDLDYSTYVYPTNLEIEKICMQKEMTVVKACLTQNDADYFIGRKQHDYAPLYTYVFSMIYSPQMIELRGWIKSLTLKKVNAPIDPNI